MPEVLELVSMKPQFPKVSLQPTFTASPTVSGTLTSTTLLPQPHMEVHTLVIVIIFCVVCLLLLLAFFYAFCFHCSISSSLKDTRTANRCNLEREDATYKRSSSDDLSVTNVV